VVKLDDGIAKVLQENMPENLRTEAKIGKGCPFLNAMKVDGRAKVGREQSPGGQWAGKAVGIRIATDSHQ
jgi:hypothetical protein